MNVNKSLALKSVKYIGLIYTNWPLNGSRSFISSGCYLTDSALTLPSDLIKNLSYTLRYSLNVSGSDVLPVNGHVSKYE